MKFLTNAITKGKNFHRIFGVSQQQFKELVARIQPLWDKSQAVKRGQKARKRAPGGGRRCHCATLEEKVAVTLLYYKTYSTQEFIGSIIGLDQANVSRLLRRMLLLMEEAADPALKEYMTKMKQEFDKIPQEERTASWEQLVQKYPDLREMATDATEQRCYRSSDQETQKKYYSGKSKKHTLKTQITTSKASGRIMLVSTTVPGSVHDKKLIDQEQTLDQIPEKTVHRFDGGYQGIQKQHPDSYIILPIKKKPKQPLSSLAKELNQVHSKRRVIVEHAFALLKKFKILALVYRGPLAHYNIIFRNIVALVNFKKIGVIA